MANEPPVALGQAPESALDLARAHGVPLEDWLVLDEWLKCQDVATTARRVGTTKARVLRALGGPYLERFLRQWMSERYAGLLVKALNTFERLLDDDATPANVQFAVAKHIDEKMTGKAAEMLLPQVDQTLNDQEIRDRIEAKLRRLGRTGRPPGPPLIEGSVDANDEE